MVFDQSGCQRYSSPPGDVSGGVQSNAPTVSLLRPQLEDDLLVNQARDLLRRHAYQLTENVLVVFAGERR